MSGMQAASLYTSIVMESTSFIVPIRDCTAEVEKSSRKMEQEQNRLAKSADRLLSSVDPVYAAQSRFNKEMDRAKSLYSAGAISAEQFAMAESNLKSRLEQATSVLATHNAVSAQSQQRMRNLGYQISDVGVQLAGGQSPFLILAQQGPQVAMAMEGAKGAVGRFASFLTGPWGAALLAGGSMLGMFASKMLESRNATEEHERSSKTLKEAIEELDRVSGMHNQTLERQIELGRSVLEDKRKQIEENIKLAKSYIAVAESQMAGPTSRGGLEINSGMMSLIEKSRTRLKELEEDLSKIDRGFRGSATALIKQGIDEKLDAMTKARNDYNRAVKALDEQLAANQINDEQYGQAYEKLTRDYKAQTDAIQEVSKRRVEVVDKELSAINSLIGQFLTERTAVEAYNERLGLLAKGLERGRLNADELALAIQRVRGAMLDDMSLEKIGPKIADFDADKSAKGLPKFDQKDLYDIPSIRKGAQAIEEARKSADRYDMAVTSVTSNMVSLGENAVFAGKSLGSVFTGLLEDLGRVAFRLTVLEPLARSFANALKGGFSGGNSIMPGEHSWLEKATKGIGSIFGLFGGARANGGPVTAGKTYLVGERGPELFTASSSGNIIPNGALKGMTGALQRIQIVPSPYFNAVVEGVAQPMVQQGATLAAAGGSAMAQQDMARRARRSLR